MWPLLLFIGAVLLAPRRERSPSPSDPIPPPLIPAGYFWEDEPYHYYDAWAEQRDGSMVRRHSEGPVQSSNSEATTRYLVIREENWNAALVRRYDWTGNGWVRVA